MPDNFIDIAGMAAGIIMPLFNIPLIVRIVKRRSSEDISLVWALGVWACIIIMAPSGFTSEDIVWRTFNCANLILFSFVAIMVVKYRKVKEK